MTEAALALYGLGAALMVLVLEAGIAGGHLKKGMSPGWQIVAAGLWPLLVIAVGVWLVFDIMARLICRG